MNISPNTIHITGRDTRSVLEHTTVRIGHRQYISEYAVRALGGTMALLAHIPLIDMRRIEGVMYVDEISFHRAMRARERSVATASNHTEAETTEAQPHRSFVRTVGLLTVTLGVGSAVMICALHLIPIVTDVSVEDTFTHSARTGDSASYATLAASPSFVLKDIIKLVRTRLWGTR